MEIMTMINKITIIANTCSYYAPGTFLNALHELPYLMIISETLILLI